MTAKLRIPNCVNTDHEGVWVLFAFLRKIVVEYELTEKPVDVYGSDMRRILDCERKDIHEFLYDHIDPRMCKIAKLNREHFVFYMKNIRTYTKEVELKDFKYIMRWAYLMGCSNYNLLEEDSLALDKSRRPYYTPMYRLDRDLFEYSRDDE